MWHEYSASNCSTIHWNTLNCSRVQWRGGLVPLSQYDLSDRADWAAGTPLALLTFFGLVHKYTNTQIQIPTKTQIHVEKFTQIQIWFNWPGRLNSSAVQTTGWGRWDWHCSHILDWFTCTNTVINKDTNTCGHIYTNTDMANQPEHSADTPLASTLLRYKYSYR